MCFVCSIRVFQGIFISLLCVRTDKYIDVFSHTIKDLMRICALLSAAMHRINLASILAALVLGMRLFC